MQWHVFAAILGTPDGLMTQHFTSEENVPVLLLYMRALYH